MSLSPDQLAQRRSSMTATDLAAIVGVHPHRRPIDVYLDKFGQADSFDGNARSKWGEILEQPIREDYERRHDVRVEVHGTMANPRAEWQAATPDGLVFPRGSNMAERGLEIKVHGRDAMWFGQLEYGQPGTDEVPPHELVQCMWGIHVTGLPVWDLIAFYDGVPNEFTVRRDDELVEMLVEAAERFRVDHVLAGVPPAPDGSESWGELQKRRWRGKKLSADIVTLEPDHPARAAIAELRQIRDDISALETRRDAIGQSLKEIIGDKAGIRWIGDDRKPQSITWKRNKPGIVTDWRAVADARRAHAQLVASAHGDMLVHAITTLRELGADDAEMMANAVAVAATAIVDIADDELEKKNTAEVEGNRPFCVPRSWGRNLTDKNQGA